MRAAIYARVSTDKQDEQNQIPILRALARQNGWIVAEEYTDTASGRDGNRPAWQRLLKDAHGHNFSVIMSTKLDRVMRSNIHLMEVLEELESIHVMIYTQDLGLLDYSTPWGRFSIQVIGGMAEWERGIISERTRAALAVKKAQGVVLGRPRSISFDYATAVRLHMSGHSWPEVAKRMNVPASAMNNRRKELKQIEDSIRAEMQPN